MIGTATYQGEKMIIVDVVGGEALITPGRADLMEWVSVYMLDNIVWVIKG